MDCGSNVSDVVRHYGRGVAEQSELSLSLLRAIDDTVEWLARIQQEAVSGVSMGQDILRTLNRCERLRAIDADGELHDLYITVEGKLKELIAQFEVKRSSAQNDRRLGEHKGDLVDEYDAAIETISQLHDVFVELRWAVSEHDADLEKPVDKTFSNAREVIAYLKKA